jgi:hypothetical protein
MDNPHQYVYSKTSQHYPTIRTEAISIQIRKNNTNIWGRTAEPTK